MIEVLKQMVEALEFFNKLSLSMKEIEIAEEAIQVGKQAIAELESQEPVAWLEPEWGEKICPEVGYEVTITDDHPRDLCWIPLYAHPPPRTWVGLTDEDWKEIEDMPDTFDQGVAWAQAKLKEKNT